MLGKPHIALFIGSAMAASAGHAFAIDSNLALESQAIGQDLLNPYDTASLLARDMNGDGVTDLLDATIDLDQDGYADSQRGGGPNDEAADQDILIAHKSDPLVFFGWYRTSQMTAPGWDIYRSSLDFATRGSNPADTKVILFTYNGDVDSLSGQADGVAVHQFLMRSGYNILEVHHQSAIETLRSSHYRDFDLAVYAWSYPRDASNIVESGIAYVGASAGQTDEMNIGTGDGTMHEFRDECYVINNSHVITDDYPLGLLTFEEGCWTDASKVAGEGIALVAADEAACDLMVKLSDYPLDIVRGSILEFTASANNGCTETLDFDEALLHVSGPASLTQTLYSGRAITMDPGDLLSKPLRLAVPGAAPRGDYNVMVEILRDGANVHSDEFDVSVF